MVVKIAICDDNKGDIDNLLKEIDMVFSKYASTQHKIEIYTHTDPNKLIEGYKAEKYDLIFLDIEMPVMDGFSVAAMLSNISRDVKIVFVTSHEDLVYDSFRYTPVEFIRKSYLSADMAKKGRYIFSKIQTGNANYIFVYNNIHTELKLSDIVYIESRRNDVYVYMSGDNNYTGSHQQNAEQYTLKNKTLKNFIGELNYNNILQIHINYAVNVEYIYGAPKYASVKLIKNDKPFELTVGRKFRDELNKKFSEYTRGL